MVKPIRQELPKPILDWIGPMPFPALQGLFDPLLPTSLQWYWKGDFVKELSDHAIDVHLDCAAKAPSELSLMHHYPIDGRRPPRRAKRDGLGIPGRDVVYGYCRYQSRPGPGGSD